MFFRHLSRLLLLTFQSERIQRATVRVEGRDDLNKSKKSEMNEMLDVLLRRHLTATRFFFLLRRASPPMVTYRKW